MQINKIIFQVKIEISKNFLPHINKFEWPPKHIKDLSIVLGDETMNAYTEVKANNSIF